MGDDARPLFRNFQRHRPNRTSGRMSGNTPGSAFDLLRVCRNIAPKHPYGVKSRNIDVVCAHHVFIIITQIVLQRFATGHRLQRLRRRLRFVRWSGDVTLRTRWQSFLPTATILPVAQAARLCNGTYWRGLWNRKTGRPACSALTDHDTRAAILRNSTHRRDRRLRVAFQSVICRRR